MLNVKVPCVKEISLIPMEEHLHTYIYNVKLVLQALLIFRRRKSPR